MKVRYSSETNEWATPQNVFDEFGVDRKCNRCNNQVLISDIKGYPYLCFECDENLFEFETYKDIEMVIGSTQKNAATTGDIKNG